MHIRTQKLIVGNMSHYGMVWVDRKENWLRRGGRWDVEAEVLFLGGGICNKVGKCYYYKTL
jgi:hypothetical protein